MNSNILLIGAGPFARNTYIPWIYSKENCQIKALVELESQKTLLRSFLEEFPSEDLEIILIPDELKQKTPLHDDVQNILLSTIKKLKIDRIILSTEPSSRDGYLDFFSTLGIPVLCDKPLLAAKNISLDPEVAKKAMSRSAALVEKFKQNKTPLIINLNRRNRPQFLAIEKKLSEYKKAGYTLSAVQMYYSGGKYDTPEELEFLENHPFKDGYGVLFHSGFHYTDLLSFLIEAQGISNEINYIEAVAIKRNAADFFYFPHKENNKINGLPGAQTVKQREQLGESDLALSFSFKSKKGTILLAQISLHSTGYNLRRTSAPPFDTLTQKGRVKHELLSLTLDPSVHLIYSYLAKQNFHPSGIKDPIIERNELLDFNGTLGNVEKTDFLSNVEGSQELKGSILDSFLKEGPSFATHPLSWAIFHAAVLACASPGHCISYEFNH